MTEIDMTALERALALLPAAHRGPAGVAGVVKDGQVIARRAWGFADMYRHLPMTAQTRLPICSMSKHLTCALLLDLFGGTEPLEPLLSDLLPNHKGPLPSVAQLCHNQSGLRDYWALTVLQGAEPEGLFTEADGLRLLGQAKGGHFAPGTMYSYSNGNFRLLAELIRRATGRDFAELLQERIFGPAGMKTATLAADTRTPADGVVGYEGNDEVGFLPAKSGVYWFGDSGVAASLDDMLAWECHIDATRDMADGLYNRLCVPVAFADGTPASYGYGLRRDVLAGYEVTSHGGGLRGFASFRLHVAAERLSVVVMFNHEASAMRAAWSLMEAALGCKIGETPGPAQGWNGLWLDEESSLLIRTVDRPTGVRLDYATSPSLLRPMPDGSAEGRGLRLYRDGDRLRMDRPGENLHVEAPALSPVDWADGQEISGRYRSDDIEAELTIEARDGASYIAFHGMLGTGPMERMYPLAADLWSVTTRRAMDAAPPGEWTLRIRRDENGRITGLTLGCWLARNIEYHVLEEPPASETCPAAGATPLR
ncbi:D-aminopeptidase [Pseudodonghicola xiamenensis]|uniref:D-aminopeptidase n=1 Tax=Pseudodonghicola xiamenensis TaxID=337702 RepID=A0A8J3HAP1_9RHOB|nr:D-aminopeptidase [Pseudodonghicola xiamenensis]GHG96247.1 D-aminopeptidase [Pseudodonghicola xiamenensis]